MISRLHIPCEEGPVVCRRHAGDIHDAALQGGHSIFRIPYWDPAVYTCSLRGISLRSSRNRCRCSATSCRYATAQQSASPRQPDPRPASTAGSRSPTAVSVRSRRHRRRGCTPGGTVCSRRCSRSVSVPACRHSRCRSWPAPCRGHSGWHWPAGPWRWSSLPRGAGCRSGRCNRGR